MATDPFKYFRVEARELLDQLGAGALELERGPAAPELVARLLRLAHTLKGAARVVKAREIADRAHAIEGVLEPFRDGGGALPPDRVEAVLALLDEISALAAALAPAPAATTPSAPPTPDEVPRTLRADVEDMDALVDGVVETTVQLAALRRSGAPVGRARRLVELLDEPAGTPRAPRLRSVLGELRDLLETLERGLTTGLDQVERELHQVRDAAERLRLLPARVMFGTLERTCRDAARSLGKRITFASSGGDVRLDPDVLAVVQRALVQAVRNAVAHGIESAGRVSIEIERRGQRVAFVCRDDGRGVDLEAVRRAAERKGLLSSDTRKLGAEELLELLLRGGITTSGTATEIAGRGIGLDVVREAASRFGGEVRVRTERGAGTELELVVPVSLSSLDALVVEAAGTTAAIPLDAVRRTIRLAPADVIAEGASIVYEGATIPFLPLARALGASPDHAHPRSAVIVESGASVCALGVDQLRGMETVVVRALPALTPSDPVVAGASLDARGNPQLVLEPQGLVAEALQVRPRARGTSTPRLPILVIDDSLTTRMLEQSILESAGYEVDVATSGEDGLDKARRRRYALFLVDVEMPGIDGFEFVERTRADPALGDIPAVLVTSRAAPEDRQRGARAGAAAYIVKSEFDQTELLDRIRGLVSAR